MYMLVPSLLLTASLMVPVSDRLAALLFTTREIMCLLAGNLGAAGVGSLSPSLYVVCMPQNIHLSNKDNQRGDMRLLLLWDSAVGMVFTPACVFEERKRGDSLNNRSLGSVRIS